MTDPLPPEKLERLLPALKHVADLVRDKGELSRDDLQLLLLASGMDEDWAVSELERWTKVLVTVRGENDERKKEIAVRALMLRGVPEAPAKLVVEVVTEPKPPEPTKRPVLPIKVSKEVIGFGELQPGQGAEATLVVSGGPGKVKVGSDMIKVEPDTFGPEETVLTVTVKGGIDGQILYGYLILESEVESIKIEIIARWILPSVSPTERICLVDPSDRTDQVREVEVKEEHPYLSSHEQWCRTIQLFAYEAYGGRQSVLWSSPHYFFVPIGQAGKELDMAFLEWFKTKRKFTQDEVLRGTWIKESDHGWKFRVRFFPDGTLEEEMLSDPAGNTGTTRIKGYWRLEGGVLRMWTYAGAEYQLDIVANKHSNVHSGLEFRNRSSVPHAYFKVTHVEQHVEW